MKRSLAILATMVLALGVVGVGYATWTSAITINGSVTTGTLSWIWTNAVPVSGFTTATFSTAGSTPQNLVITVTNVYPGWKGYIDVTEQNTGTLPLTFQSFEIQSTSGNGFAPYYQVAFYAPTGGVLPNNIPSVMPFDGCNYAAWINQIDGFAVPYTNLAPPSTPGSVNLGVNYPSAVTLMPSGVTQTKTSRISLFLDPSVPEAWMNTAYTFTFTHTGVVALP